MHKFRFKSNWRIADIKFPSSWQLETDDANVVSILSNHKKVERLTAPKKEVKEVKEVKEIKEVAPVATKKKK